MRIGEINQVAEALLKRWHVFAGSVLAMGSQERPIIERWIEGEVPALKFRSKVIVTDLIRAKVLLRNRSIEIRLDGAWYDLDVEALQRWRLDRALLTDGAE